MAFLLIIVFVGVAIFEVPGLVKNKQWRELSVFSILLLFVFMITLLQTIGVKIPNPIKGFQYLIKEILHLSYE